MKRLKKKKHNKNNHKTSKYKTAGRNEKKTTATAVKTWKHSQYFGWSTVSSYTIWNLTQLTIRDNKIWGRQDHQAFHFFHLFIFTVWILFDFLP